MTSEHSAERLVAVTGASGFVGGRAVRCLAASGCRLRVLARDPGRLPPLPEQTEVVPGSLQDETALQQLVRDADAVVHLAGSVRGVTREQFNQVNAIGTGACATTAAAAGVPRFLLISSLAAREPRLSAYAASKRAGEDRVANAAGAMGVTVFRPPAVYGPGDVEMRALFRLMARGIAPVFGAATARFSLLFVDDLASAILSWVEAEAPPETVLEIDDGKQDGYGWTDVCDTVSGLTGRPVRQFRLPGPLLGVPAAVNYIAGRLGLSTPMLTPGKLRELRHPDWVCRPGIAAALPSWQPRFTLIDGLRNTPDWRG